MRAAGTPSTAPVSIPMPSWDAPSLRTGAVALPERRPRRWPRALTVVLGIAALTLLAVVIVQLVVR